MPRSPNCRRSRRHPLRRRRPMPPPAMKKHRGRFTRPLLLFGVPLLVVLFSCYAYLHAGRFVDTNNAYVKADKAIIAAEVTGKIVEVAVKENDHVEARAVAVPPRRHAVQVRARSRRSCARADRAGHRRHQAAVPTGARGNRTRAEQRRVRARDVRPAGRVSSIARSARSRISTMQNTRSIPR